LHNAGSSSSSFEHAALNPKNPKPKTRNAERHDTEPSSKAGFCAAAAEASMPIYNRILEMEFISQMLDGTLDKKVMAKYLVQVPSIQVQGPGFSVQGLDSF
jgi:hypothetical protein